MNINCVICSDLFNPADSIFSTSCGHVFHHACLLQWIERKKDCPQCRQRCTERNMFKIFFNTTNINSTQQTSAELLDTIDTLTLKIRSLDASVKNAEEQRRKLEVDVENKEKKISRLSASNNNSLIIISTMKHEIDMLSRQRAGYKVLETENVELKSRLNLLQTIESVLTASQKEIDEIMQQKDLSFKDIAAMVGTLRRELNNTECRKNELRKQLQSIRNDLRAEQEEKKKLQDELSKMESENNLMMNQFKRIKTDYVPCEDGDILDTPERTNKKSRLALTKLDSQNTPSPLNQHELNRRIQTIQESNSPYFKVQKSSIALACVLKNPKQISKEQQKGNGDEIAKLSIFKKPRISQDPFSKKSNASIVYNGIGGSAH